MCYYGPPHMTEQKQYNQLEHTYSSYVRIQDVALKTYQRWWMIGRSGERGSRISVLAAQHDDDDDDEVESTVSIKVSFLKYSLSLWSLEYVECIRCRRVRAPQKRGIFCMTLDCFWWWGSTFRDLGMWSTSSGSLWSNFLIRFQYYWKI